MDVLLLNPNSRKEGYVKEPPLITPPINLMYIAQSLEDNGYKNKILDGFALNLDDEKILPYIKNKDPDMIGIPLYSSDLTKMYHFTNKIKNLNEEIKIFFAGHHATVLHKKAMEQFPKVDFIIRGEGEFTTIKLLEKIENSKSLSNVRGISYRENNKVFHNKDEKPIENLDSIPIPSRKLIDKNLYYSKMSKRDKVDVMITSRGCPYKCTFCARLTDTFRNFRQRSADNIVEELNMIQESGGNNVEIYDEIFTLKRKKILEIINKIKEEKLDLEYRIRTRVTHVDKDLLSSLKNSGCSTVSYGVESGNQKIIDNIRKETTLEQIKRAFKITENSGINILGFFMIGNRGDTPTTIRQTINFAKKLNPLFATFGVLHPYPGTIDYNKSVEDGRLQGEYAPFKPMPWVKLPWTKDVKQLYNFSNRAYNEYYKRPKYISKFLTTTIRQGNWNLLKYSAENFYKKISSLNAI